MMARSRDMPGASRASAPCSNGKVRQHRLERTPMNDLFDDIAPLPPSKQIMAQGAVLLRGIALPFEKKLLAALGEIIATSPFRHMVTPGGYTMSVAMTN